MRLATLALLLLTALPAWAQSPNDEEAHAGVFAIVNARIETVANGAIERGTLVLRDGDIVAVGADVEVPAGAEVIDAEGLTAYPGFFDGGTRIGLAEVGSLAETRDANEIGAIIPHMEALTAVNPNSVHVPITRANGVLVALAEPTGGLLPGTAALVRLHGYTPAQMLVEDVQPVVAYFPSSARRGSWDDREEEEIEKEAEEAREKLSDTFAQARLYLAADSAYAADPEANEQPPYAPALAALVPVLRGEQALLLHANKAEDIEAALAWVEEQELPHVILAGAQEGWRVAGEIAEAGLPVVAGPVLSVPLRGSSAYDAPYANAGRLAEAGVPVALRTAESENIRNLPFHAGFAAAYGLGREAALRSVTLGAAEIWGVADRLGSLEIGKEATLFLADGDPFEPATQVRHVFVNGWKLPLIDRQVELYDEFLDRAPGLE